MATRQKTLNDLICDIADRAAELTRFSMPALRMGVGTADTDGGLRSELMGKDKGDLIADILVEEFTIENDQDLE